MRRATQAIIAVLTITLIIAVPATAQLVSMERLPASVVMTGPRCGDTNVDPDLNEISATFSKDMLDQAWSFVQISAESFPKLVGSPQYLNDKRTCVVKVALEPERTYAVWLNSERFQNFRDLDKQPAVPYLLVFKTAKRK